MYPKYLHDKIQTCLTESDTNELKTIDSRESTPSVDMPEPMSIDTTNSQTQTEPSPMTTTETQTASNLAPMRAVGTQTMGMNNPVQIARTTPVKRKMKEMEDEITTMEPPEKRVDLRQPQDDDEIVTREELADKPIAKLYTCEKCGTTYKTIEAKYSHQRLAHPTNRPPIGRGHAGKRRSKGKVENKPRKFQLWLPTATKKTAVSPKPKIKVQVPAGKNIPLIKNKLVKNVKTRNKFAKWE